MTDEFDMLTLDQRTAVEQAIALVRTYGCPQTVGLPGNVEARAYRIIRGRYAWAIVVVTPQFAGIRQISEA